MVNDKPVIDIEIPEQIKAPEQNKNTAAMNHKELMEIFEGPAIACSKMYVGFSQGMARITFCEEIIETKDVKFRCAVVLPISGLFSLQQLLAQSLQVYQQQAMAQQQAIENMAKEKAN